MKFSVILENIYKRLEEIELKMDKILNQETTVVANEVDIPKLLELPNHLLKPLVAVYKLNEATIYQVMNVLNMDRTSTNSNLNQLVRLGYLERRRKGRKWVYKLKGREGE